MLAATHIAEAAAALSEVVARLVDLLHLLFDVSDMLAPAFIAVAAAAFLIVVALFVQLFGRTRAWASVSALLLATTFTRGTITSWLLRLLHKTAAVVIRPMQVATAVAIRALRRLLEVMALTARWWLDRLALGVLVVAILTVAATSGVAERAADLLSLRHCVVCGTD